ncbi:outer membrane beta-barrel protein [Petrotoga sp. 9PWA.NaAc.5.4]|uniref:outer membrane beta-barrel protein n=1 Tax=Petrotoga sp. 9PWA.NaAc.5.4 TaxID=1434328 RepID=UPI000CA7D7C3|nr:outer membrane beta-barrel protein [Petrotoga sp. 9PWA.NaAc.5.4]PNR97242.1 hypothetical protein X924_01340 [Petrotoga sp. 9PWA.NaAc.5.4]
MKKVFTTILILTVVIAVYSLDIIGGGSYNTYNFDYYIDGEKMTLSDEVLEEVGKGFGAYAGIAVGGNVGMEFGADWFQSKYDGTDGILTLSQNTLAPYGALRFRINTLVLPLSIDAKVGLSYYMNETTYKGELSWGSGSITLSSGEKYSGLGYFAGAGVNIGITNTLSLSLNGTYRWAKIPLTEEKSYSGEYVKYEGESTRELDLSGWKIGAGLVLEF